MQLGGARCNLGGAGLRVGGAFSSVRRALRPLSAPSRRFPRRASTGRRTSHRAGEAPATSVCRALSRQRATVPCTRTTLPFQRITTPHSRTSRACRVSGRAIERSRIPPIYSKPNEPVCKRHFLPHAVDVSSMRCPAPPDRLRLPDGAPAVEPRADDRPAGARRRGNGFVAQLPCTRCRVPGPMVSVLAPATLRGDGLNDRERRVVARQCGVDRQTQRTDVLQCRVAACAVRSAVDETP